LDALHQEVVEVERVIVTAEYPKGGGADIFRSKYCYIATDGEVVNITRSYRLPFMLLPETALRLFDRNFVLLFRAA
jgi:hypothetical protein